jgi:hypothetical protein
MIDHARVAADDPEQITCPTHLMIELVAPDAIPTVIKITWPPQRKCATAAVCRGSEHSHAAACRTLRDLARIKASKRR